MSKVTSLPLIENATSSNEDNEPQQYQEFIKFMESKNKVNGRLKKRRSTEGVKFTNSLSGESSITSSRNSSITPRPPSSSKILPLNLDGESESESESISITSSRNSSITPRPPPSKTLPLKLNGESTASSVTSSRNSSILTSSLPPSTMALSLNGENTNNDIDMFVENVILKIENLLLSIDKNMIKIINIEIFQCDLQMIRFHCERLQNILTYSEYYKEQVHFR